jgi:BTB/POZ domain
VSGEEKKEFQVPRDLLSKSSPVFNAMCNSAFKESIEGVIELPEVNPSTFGNFMVWLHSCPPAFTENDHLQTILDLAIFADTYQVYPLKNQTTDLFQKRLLLKKAIHPATLMKIYESTPDGSILQELVSLAFFVFPKTRLSTEVLSQWEDVFEQFPTFGRDYFRNGLQYQKGEAALSRTGTCYFHDHGNMTGYNKDSVERSSPCPYADGGDWIDNERELQKQTKT